MKQMNNFTRKIKYFLKFISEDNIAYVVIIKIILTFSIIILTFKFVGFNETTYEVNHVSPPTETRVTKLEQALTTWDAQWYMFIAENGYAIENTYAFSPLYPFLISTLNPIFGTILSGLIISNICFFFGCILFFKLTKEIFSAKIARLSMIFLLAFPSSFFFSLIYTESLFFFITILFFYLVKKDRVVLAALISFLLPFTRSLGVFIFFPLLWIIFSKKKFSYYYLLANIPFLGFLIVQLNVFLLSGSWTANFDAQSFWIAGNNIGNIFLPLKWFKESFIQPLYTLHGYTTSVIDRVMFLLFTWNLGSIWKDQKLSFFLIAFFFGIIPALMGNLMSYTRFLVVVFPLFIQLSISTINSKYQKYYLLIISSALQLFFITQHATSSWAG